MGNKVKKSLTSFQKKIKFNTLILNALNNFSLERHGKKVEWRSLPHPKLKSNYRLSEYGDLIKILVSGKIKEIKLRWTYKKGKIDKKARNGVSPDQFYEDKKRWLITPRTRLMMWVFGDWKFKDLYLKNNPSIIYVRNLQKPISLKNMYIAENAYEGQANVTGLKRFSKVSDKQRLEIKRTFAKGEVSKSFLARKYGISNTQVRRILEEPLSR